ncbi:MAG: 50S ribosomal protein L9 [Syntrophomonadaceae bacterium]|nr:50S ribosomal protein L9 [Syntrophomonadaceae bacterium]
MKVILTQDVKKQGVKGQIIEVSDGYARNYLIPKGLAEEASKTRVKEIEEKKVRDAKLKDKEKEQAEQLKARLDGQTIELKAKTGSNEKLFGAVTSQEIADTLEKRFGVKIDKKKIEQGEVIKHLGEYSFKIKIYPAIQAELKLIVTAE